MADRISKSARSENMRAVRSRDTKPELAVRSALFRRGFRFVVNGNRNKKLPGKPDIVLPKYRTVIFVHGCFWHQHPGCSKSNIPESNREFWQSKLYRNVERDEENIFALERAGWNVLVVWECELAKNAEKAVNYLAEQIHSCQNAAT